MTTRTAGLDYTLPLSPPLVKPPLSLLQLATSLVRVDDAVAARQEQLEKLASAQAQLADLSKRLADVPSHLQTTEQQQAIEEAREGTHRAAVWLSDAAEQLAEVQRWEDGFEYLPELSLAESLEVYVPGSGATKRTDATNSSRFWYDPFEVVAHDDRSVFGWPASDYEDRSNRAMRSLLSHEAWEVEHEFWTGRKIPTNYHLSASPSTPTTSPHRTIDAWAAPTAAPGTTLGTAVGLKQSLAALDEAIARSDAGTGMIHATPYLVQLWQSQYGYIRDSSGRIFTVNMNLIVPGYGYPGTGPDSDRSVTDGVTNGTTTVTSATAAFTTSDVGKSISTADLPAGTYIVSVTNSTTVVVSQAATGSHNGQTLVIDGSDTDSEVGAALQWAYATETVYTLQGASRRVPYELNQMSPDLVVDNSAEVRAERSHALITNRLLRAAVLVDTTT